MEESGVCQIYWSGAILEFLHPRDVAHGGWWGVWCTKGSLYLSMNMRLSRIDHCQSWQAINKRWNNMAKNVATLWICGLQQAFGCQCIENSNWSYNLWQSIGGTSNQNLTNGCRTGWQMSSLRQTYWDALCLVGCAVVFLAILPQMWSPEVWGDPNDSWAARVWENQAEYVHHHAQSPRLK